MKTKIICGLLLSFSFFLCGCGYNHINKKYTVRSCEGIIIKNQPAYFIIEVYETGREYGKMNDGAQKFYSDTPLAVGGNYILRMEEVK